MSNNEKKAVGIVSLALGIFAWAGEKFGWITTKVSDWLNAVSLALGALVTFA